MAQTVKRAYKYRFYPTPEQAESSARTFGCARLVYNRALEERTRAYALKGQPLVCGVVGVADRVEAHRRPGVPERGVLGAAAAGAARTCRRRSRTSSPSGQVPDVQVPQEVAGLGEFTAPRSPTGAASSPWRRWTCPLDIVWSRPLPEGAEPSTVTVCGTRPGRWFVSILVEDTIAPAAADRRGGRHRRGDHFPWSRCPPIPG